MFRNLHLASYVNQLQKQQQQNRVNSQKRPGTQSITSRGSFTMNAPGVSNSRPIQQISDFLGSENTSQDDPNFKNPLLFMAVGSRLSMATYAKKESSNISTTVQPGLNSQFGERRKQQQTMPQQQELISGAKGSANAPTGKPIKSSMNSDIFPFAKAKKGQKRAKSKPSLKQSICNSEEEAEESNFVNLDQKREHSPSLYKLKRGLPMKQECDQTEAQELNNQSINEACGESCYLPMNVQAKNAVSSQGYLLKLVEAQQIDRGQENAPIGLLPPKVDSLMETTFDVRAEQLKDGKSQLTVRAVTRDSGKKFKISEIHIDQENFTFNKEESKDQLKTSSIMTQNYHYLQSRTGDDYRNERTTTALLLRASPTQQIIQKVMVLGNVLTGADKEKHRSMLIVNNDQAVTRAGLDFRDPKLNTAQPNLANESDLKTGTQRSPSAGSPQTPSQILEVDPPENCLHAGMNESLTARGDYTEIKNFTTNGIINSLNFGAGKRSVLSQKKQSNQGKRDQKGAMIVFDKPQGSVDTTTNVTMSAANFSNLERQQQKALLGITGSTLSQYMTTQNMKLTPAQWKQKQMSDFLNVNNQRAVYVNQIVPQTRQHIQKVGSTPGLKGAKLPKNSNFHRMHGFVKKRAEADVKYPLIDYHSQGAFIMSQDQSPNIFMIDQGTNANKDAFPSHSNSQQRTTRKQTITVQEKRPKTEENCRQRHLTVMAQYTSLPETPSHQAEEAGEYEAKTKGKHPLICPSQHQNAVLVQSWNSSNENERQQLKATMEQMEQTELTNNFDPIGTILISSPQSSQLVALKKPIIPKKKSYIQFERRGTVTREPEEVGFESIVRPNCGSFIMQDMFTDQIKYQSLATKLSKTQCEEQAHDGQIKISVESKQSKSNIVQIHSDIQQYENDEFCEIKQIEEAAILNFPPPINMDTIGSKRSKSGRKICNTGVTPSTLMSGRQLFSPKMRTFQKKDGENRNARSQQQKRKQKTENIKEGVVLGTRFKPQIVFRENEMQQLFDKAEQPVQQVIQKVLLDEFDQFQIFGYMPSAKTQRKKSPMNASHREGEHLKYQFIEKLLRQPDKDLTSKTLQEMASLYQELLEKQSNESGNLKRAKVNTQASQGSILISSQKSIIVTTDKVGRTLHVEQAVNCHKMQKGEISNQKSLANKKDSGNTKLKQTRASLQIKMDDSERSPLIENYQNMQQSMIDMCKEEVKRVRKFEGGSTGGNILFLDIGMKNWESKQEINAKDSQNRQGSQLIEIDGKKANILKNHKDEQMIITECDGKKKSSDAKKVESRAISPSQTAVPTKKHSRKASQDIVQPPKPQLKLLQSSELTNRANSQVKEREKHETKAQVLISHTPIKAAPKKPSTYKTAQKRQKTENYQSPSHQPKNQEHTSLSPRINAIEKQIYKLNAQTQVKTSSDVQNLAKILALGVSLAKQPIEPTQINNEKLHAIQKASSAYPSFRANRKNHRRVVVGNEIRHFKERQTFVEHLFNPSSSSMLELQSQILNQYEKKLASTAPLSKQNTFNSDSTKNVAKLNGNSKQVLVKDYQHRVQFRQDGMHSSLTKQDDYISGCQSRSDNQTEESPLKIKDTEIKDTPVIVVGSASNRDSRKEDPSPKASQKQRGNKIIDPSAAVARYQKKEETTEPSPRKESERKHISKHELKVPKAGQLDAVKASRIRQLSSNQVTGFRIRGGNFGVKSSEQIEETEQMYSSYGMSSEQVAKNAIPASNQDLVDFLKSPKSKSQLNVLNDREEDELHIDSQDQDEVGTQMIGSGQNLNPTSPRAVQHLEKASKSDAASAEDQAGEMEQSDETQTYTSLQKKIFGGKATQDSKVLANRKINSSHTLRSSMPISKIGTIKVKELYNQRELSPPIVSQATKPGSRSKPEKILKKQKNLNMSLLRLQMHERSQAQIANFERLSGLISESCLNQKKARLIAHQQRIKEAKRDERANKDWRIATPVISMGSTFYKDLFDLRSQQEAQQPGFSYSSQTKKNLEIQISQLDETQEAFHQRMMILSHAQQKPRIGNLLRNNPIRNQKDVFTISKSAVQQSSQILIGQLLSQVDGQFGVKKNPVQPLKQNCLLQHILEEWSSTIKGQLRNFMHSCTFARNLQVGEDKTVTDAYSVIIYGKHTPISNCCKQLICFQFTEYKRQVSVYCLEPSCRKSKLESKPLNQEIFRTIFLTANTTTSTQEVNLRKPSPRRSLLVSNYIQQFKKHETPTRKLIALNSQNQSRVSNQRNINSLFVSPDNNEILSSSDVGLCGKNHYSNHSRLSHSVEKTEINLFQMQNEPKTDADFKQFNSVIRVDMLTNGQQENLMSLSNGQISPKQPDSANKFYNRQQTLLDPKVRLTQLSDGFCFDEIQMTSPDRDKNKHSQSVLQ